MASVCVVNRSRLTIPANVEYHTIPEILNRAIDILIESGSIKQFYNFANLSDGEKCLIALSTNIAYWLIDKYPEMKDPLGGEATILIDDIEKHIHPIQQYGIVPGLLKTFPNCQFIVTTNSPMVLSTVHSKNVWCLSLHDGEISYIHPETTYGQDINFLLKTVMMSSSRSEHIDKNISLLFGLIREDTAKARELLNKLASEIEGESPDLVRAQTLLHRREFLNS